MVLMLPEVSDQPAVHRDSAPEIRPCLPSTPLPPWGISPSPQPRLSPCEQTGWLYPWCREGRPGLGPGQDYQFMRSTLVT